MIRKPEVFLWTFYVYRLCRPPTSILTFPYFNFPIFEHTYIPMSANSLSDVYSQFLFSGSKEPPRPSRHKNVELRVDIQRGIEVPNLDGVASGQSILREEQIVTYTPSGDGTPRKDRQMQQLTTEQCMNDDQNDEIQRCIKLHEIVKENSTKCQPDWEAIVETFIHSISRRRFQSSDTKEMLKSRIEPALDEIPSLSSSPQSSQLLSSKVSQILSSIPSTDVSLPSGGSSSQQLILERLKDPVMSRFPLRSPMGLWRRVPKDPFEISTSSSRTDQMTDDQTTVDRIKKQTQQIIPPRIEPPTNDISVEDNQCLGDSVSGLSDHRTRKELPPCLGHQSSHLGQNIFSKLGRDTSPAQYHSPFRLNGSRESAAILSHPSPDHQPPERSTRSNLSVCISRTAPDLVSAPNKIRNRIFSNFSPTLPPRSTSLSQNRVSFDFSKSIRSGPVEIPSRLKPPGFLSRAQLDYGLTEANYRRRNMNCKYSALTRSDGYHSDVDGHLDRGYHSPGYNLAIDNHQLEFNEFYDPLKNSLWMCTSSDDAKHFDDHTSEGRRMKPFINRDDNKSYHSSNLYDSPTNQTRSRCRCMAPDRRCFCESKRGSDGPTSVMFHRPTPRFQKLKSRPTSEVKSQPMRHQCSLLRTTETGRKIVVPNGSTFYFRD